MLFNISLGIVNASGLFTVMLDPDSTLGLDEELCENGLNDTPAGFNGEWKNVGGAGYKCYFKGTQTAMSEEFRLAQLDLVNDAENPGEGKSLISPQNEAGIFQFTQGLLGSFGNAIRVIPTMFSLFSTSIAFPTQYMMALFPCPDTNYYKEGEGVGRISLNSEWGGDKTTPPGSGYERDVNGKVTIGAAPCIENSSVDGYESILGYIQSGMYILYIIFIIQFIANRGFRGMT
jgi:hypothetical protein